MAGTGPGMRAQRRREPDCFLHSSPLWLVGAQSWRRAGPKRFVEQGCPA
ncbi:hypothetical protein FAIPA1_510007 [Frankia sp. AiPs1]